MALLQMKITTSQPLEENCHMNVIQRKKDLILGGEDLEHLHTFGNFPVFMGCVDHERSKDLLCDMSWHISRSSGLVQLSQLLPLDVVYKSSHGSGTTGKLWDLHHEKFSEFVSSFNVRKVLEIGGGHGTLASKFLSKNNDASWTIVEPNPTVRDNQSIKVIKRFFDGTFKCDDQVDAIVNSHVLEHVYDPHEFLSHISSFTKVGNLLIFSIPNMEFMIRNNYTNCVNFEHTFLLTEPYVEFLLGAHKFSVVEKKYFKNDHSIFYCARREKDEHIVSLSDDLTQKNSAYFMNYVDSHVRDVQNLNNLMSEIEGPIYLFGAHVFSQYLIAFGLRTEKITSLLDNDVKKDGKRLYGTKLHSRLPKILKGAGKVHVILRAGTYNNEIRDDILSNINPDVVFL